ncbi:MAG: DUF3618 domain-containing protein [Microbacteriaceae bacterium]
MKVRDWEALTAQTRAELGGTLDAIEEKFNVPVQVRRGVAGARASMAKDPVPWIVGAGVAMLALTSAAFAVLRLNKD